MALIIAGSYLAGPKIDQFLRLDEAKYWLFETLSQLSARPIRPRFVKLLLIADDDYWLGTPAGRAPIKREYLATVLHKLAQSHVRVIALDFDMRSVDPTSPRIAADYRAETDDLIDTIIRVAENHKVVLAKSMWVDAQNRYILDQDVYQSYGICDGIDARGAWINKGSAQWPLSASAAVNISCGYVALPDDLRVVAAIEVLANQRRIDSFAMAIARAADPKLVERMDDDSHFASYLTQREWDAEHATFTVGDILRRTDSDVDHALGHSIVIIGGTWSRMAFQRGTPADFHDTPVGGLVGSVVHANFVEAILGQRTFRGTSAWVPRICEVLFSLMAAVVFSLREGIMIKIAGLAGMTLLLVFLQWALLQALGIFFEAIVPVLGLFIHSIVERFIVGKEEKEVLSNA